MEMQMSLPLFFQRLTAVLVLVFGIVLVANLSANPPRDNGDPTMVKNASCTGSWTCFGNTEDVCTFTAGRVPVCVAPSTQNCSYATPGYICNGKNPLKNACTI